MRIHIMHPTKIVIKKATFSQYGMWINNKSVYYGSKQRCLGFLESLKKVFDVLDLTYIIEVEAKVK